LRKPPPSPLLFFSAGEASGDHYGAQILSELRNRIPDLRAFGLGGLEMATAGLERIVRAEDVAVMGITEVILHMPYIYGEYRRLVAAIKANRPQLAVLIDFPDVNLRLARELKQLDIPVIYFVSPQLWAWKRRRLEWVRRRVTKMLVIFPFEEPFYRTRDVDAEFVGHPLAALAMPSISREDFAQKHGADASKKWISLLPGSRRKEVRSNLPEMLKAAEILNRNRSHEFFLPVANTVGLDFVKGVIREHSPLGLHVKLVDDARSVMFHSSASVVASGTATVQAAIIGNPFVIVYRVSDLTYRLARALVSYPPEIVAARDTFGNLSIGMVNLIAGRRIVPELLQDRFNAEKLAAELGFLLEESPRREKMITDLAEVRSALLSSTGGDPIQRVCDVVESGLNVTL
jgi:lipid-A-disaccharide synthase